MEKILLTVIVMASLVIIVNFKPNNDSKVGEQTIELVVEAETIKDHNAFVYAQTEKTTDLVSRRLKELQELIQAQKTDEENTNQSITSLPKSNIVIAGGDDGVVGIVENTRNQRGSHISWQVGELHELWFKTFVPTGSDIKPAIIIPELQVKPSVISLTYSNHHLIIPGEIDPITNQHRRFTISSLRLAHSIDGITWKTMDNSLVNADRQFVAAVDKVGGYYMIVADPRVRD